MEPREAHYRICSPLQDRPWEEELLYKQQYMRDAYAAAHIAELLPAELPVIADEERQFGYRNKMEFSFVDLTDTPKEQSSATKSLAFFERGAKRRIPIDGCALAEPVINTVAQYILAWVNEMQIPLRSLKSLMVRSNGKGEALAALFIKDELPFAHYPACTPELRGFTLYYSTHKSPASVPTRLMYHDGADTLTASVLGTELQFGLLSFFQVNISIFEQAVARMGEYIESGTTLVDYYAGVGAISLPLASRYAQATLVESNSEAAAFAQANIARNHIEHAQAHCIPAEKMRELVTHDATVIFDPPRSGLHPKIVAQVREERPQRIIYLSCNGETQARDVAAIADLYHVRDVMLYNFFPRALHVEGLCVLDRRA